MSDQSAFTTFQQPGAADSDVNQMRFLMRRYLASFRTCTLAQVLTVTNAGGDAPAGTLTLQPLVQQTDGAGNVVDLPVLYNVPYSRLQGGTNAVILDPVVGDIGVVVFGDRDLSAVIASGQKSPPGSSRRASLSDALWIGGLLNGANEAPQQYVDFAASGITINSPTAVTAQIGTRAGAAQLVLNGSGITLSFGGNSIAITSSGIAITGPVTGSSTATFTGEVEGNSIKLSVLKVTGVQTGSGVSGPPQPGT